MKTEIKDGKIIIELDFHEAKLSQSGKALVFAETGSGVKTGINYKGMDLRISAQVYAKNTSTKTQG